jgi:hypothetical protein
MITRAIVFLLLGAIVNVAVAWGFAIVHLPGYRFGSFTGITLEPVGELNGEATDCEVSVGVPLRTFRGQLDSFYGDPLHDIWTIRFIGERYLPVDTIWPGFVLNTVFYAVILWVAWRTPDWRRRYLRFHQGRCPACGYQIVKGVGPVCSECGAPLPARWKVKTS